MESFPAFHPAFWLLRVLEVTPVMIPEISPAIDAGISNGIDKAVGTEVVPLPGDMVSFIAPWAQVVFKVACAWLRFGSNRLRLVTMAPSTRFVRDCIW